MKTVKCLFLILLLLLPMGCGTVTPRLSATAEASEPVTSSRSEALRTAAPESVSYPLDTDTRLSALVPVDPWATDDAAIFSELSEKTGVSVDFLPLAADDYMAGINQCIAGGDLTDLVYCGEQWIFGEPEDSFYELTDYLTTCAPNYLQMLTADEATMLDCLSGEEEEIYYFYTFLESPTKQIGFGPVIRTDLLEKHGLQMPETYDDWETVLSALREDVEEPLILTGNVLQQNYLSAGYGVSLGFQEQDSGFYQVDGTVKYGILEPEYTELVTRLHSWTEQGFIGKRTFDFMDMSSSDYLLKMAGGAAAIFYLPADAMASVTALSEIPGFSIAPIPDPVLNAGDTPHLTNQRLSRIRSAGFAVSLDCADPKTAVRFVDYLYSDEGLLLGNFGQEQETYTLKDGVPTYTEAALKDPSLLAQATCPYFVGQLAETTMALQLDGTVVEASKVWIGHRDSAWHLPLISLDPDEQEDFDMLTVDLKSYVVQETWRLISGDTDLTFIPDIQEKLRDMGVEKGIAILQEGLDSYYAQ